MSETKVAVVTKVDLLKPLASEKTVEALLEQYRRSFEVAAPQHLDVNRVMRVALMTMSRSESLLKCSAASLLGAFMLSVQLGLDIGAKECHLVPFKGQIQLVPDYRGVLKLARNSREICGMRARNVYKQDLFQLEEGSQPRLLHTPNFDHPRDPKDIIGVYSIADFCNPETRVPTGYTDVHYLPRVHIDKVRSKSPAKDDGPWVTHYDEMSLKTCIKHHSKTLPYSIQMATAIDLDNRVEMVRPQSIELMESPQGLITATLPPETPEQTASNGETKTETKPQAGPAITEQQTKRAYAIGKAAGFSTDQYRALVKKHGFNTDRDITEAVYDTIVAELQKGPSNAA